MNYSLLLQGHKEAYKEILEVEIEIEQGENPTLGKKSTSEMLILIWNL